MKRTRKSRIARRPQQAQAAKGVPLLAFGAHPDDIEFGCGGVVANETRAGRPAHFVVCSRGEAGTHGTPEKRTAEAEASAAVLGATVEFVELDGDARLEVRAAHALLVARIIRRLQPEVVLAPTTEENQHPDHGRLGRIVRDACRLARYGGISDLSDTPAHSIGQLFYYAISPEAEPSGVLPVLVDVSESTQAWVSAMECHATQLQTRNYVDLQVVRARVFGLRAGVEFAMALFPNDPVLISSLAAVTRGARRF